jgi:tRNA pseudouridine13 synthase
MASGDHQRQLCAIEVNSQHFLYNPRPMLPYLTPEFPGVGGVIKQRAEDFFVQEIPLYEPNGEGEHVYCEIQKIGVTTFQAIHRLASVLNVSPRDIGYAGMKDAHAITRQIFSIQGTTPEAVMAAKFPDMTVQWAARHGNKLRLGHLLGNRFAIKIREVNPTDVVKLQPVIETIQRRGMPNFFGEQRFGRRNNNDVLGAALIRGDNEAVLKLLLGGPNEELDDGRTMEARRAFDRRDNVEALRLFPRTSGMERRVLARLMKTHRPAAAIHAIDDKLRRLWVSALQSRVFNDVLSQRIGTIDKLMDGDLAYKHDNGACFRVESAATEQARCEAFEISPTGPLVGYRMTLPEGEPLAMEQRALATIELKAEDFRQSGKLRTKGARRSMRVKPVDINIAGGVDEHGNHITVAFTLPSGAFATVLLRELMKSEITEPDLTPSPGTPGEGWGEGDLEVEDASHSESPSS